MKCLAEGTTQDSAAARKAHLDNCVPATCPADDLADEPAFRQRAELISRRHLDSIRESVTDLAELGLVAKASAEVRVHGGAAAVGLFSCIQKLEPYSARCILAGFRHPHP
jgi:hypothetical protein